MRLYLADTSAWHRATNPAVSVPCEQQLMADTLATCAQIRLEVLYLARCADDYEKLSVELIALHQLPCTAEHFERALAVQHLLAGRGGLHHRSVKIADLIIAASAEAAGATVWHYHEDFDRIADVTGSPRSGSLREVPCESCSRSTRSITVSCPVTTITGILPAREANAGATLAAGPRPLN